MPSESPSNPQSTAEDGAWVCNQCGSAEFSGSVSEDCFENDGMSCVGCGGTEFHWKGEPMTKAEVGGNVKVDLKGRHGRWTSGEWGVKDCGSIGIEVVSLRPSGHVDTVCDMMGPEDKANAHLISAAPDLYEALRSMMAEFEHASSGTFGDVAKTKSRAALLKANPEPSHD